MIDDLATAIEFIRHLKKTNRYDGCRIGRLKTIGSIAASFSYRVDDIVLYTVDGDDEISISRPWRAISIQVMPGYFEHRGSETIGGLTNDYVDDCDYPEIPAGLYEQNHGVGRAIMKGIDALVKNGHREAAFLLLLNIISGLSRRRYPDTGTKSDRVAFSDFINDELHTYQIKNPELDLDFGNTAFYTMKSEYESIGDWLYKSYRCVLVHNTKTSSLYRLDLSCETMGSMYFNVDSGVEIKCIGFWFYRLLRQLVADAVENDESF